MWCGISGLVRIVDTSNQAGRGSIPNLHTSKTFFLLLGPMGPMGPLIPIDPNGPKGPLMPMSLKGPMGPKGPRGPV